jgi:hypothetical protein
MYARGGYSMMRPSWLSFAVVAAVGTIASGCTIQTTYEDANAPQTPHHQRRHHQRGNPPPPPPAARPGSPAPAAQPARPGVGRKAAPRRREAVSRAEPVMLQPARRPVKPSAQRAELMKDGIGAGRPAGFVPGAPAAYWIWQGPRGGWRVRTTTAGAAHEFRGRVHGMTGAVSNVHPSRTEFRDRVWKEGNDWAFHFSSKGHADGFTFVTRDNGCVRFDLDLGGGPGPKRVFVGRGQLSPPGGNFIVCAVGSFRRRAATSSCVRRARSPRASRDRAWIRVARAASGRWLRAVRRA